VINHNKGVNHMYILIGMAVGAGIGTVVNMLAG
jgi:gas vesicle protein